MILKDKVLEVILNNKYFRNLILEDTNNELLPGLYDTNDVMLCTWEESGIDNTCSNVANIVQYTYPTTTKIVFGNITTISNNAFYNCSNLTDILFSSTITSIGSYTFRDCKNLTNVVLPNNIISIGQGAFYGCSNLSNIILSKKLTAIPHTSFYETGLTSITIPDGVTGIYITAFGSCYNLASIIIPASVTYIGETVFNNCYSLKTIYFKGTQAQWNAISKGEKWKFNCPSDMQVIYNYIPE